MRKPAEIGVSVAKDPIVGFCVYAFGHILIDIVLKLVFQNAYQSKLGFFVMLGVELGWVLILLIVSLSRKQLGLLLGVLIGFVSLNLFNFFIFLLYVIAFYAPPP